MLRTIRQVTLEPNYALRLSYDDGQVVVVNFKPVVRRGGVFAALGDPHFFSQVSIGEGGRYIQWPGDLDFCADALWYEGHADNS